MVRRQRLLRTPAHDSPHHPRTDQHQAERRKPQQPGTGLQRRIVKVMPREYKRALAEQTKARRAAPTDGIDVVTKLRIDEVVAGTAVVDKFVNS